MRDDDTISIATYGEGEHMTDNLKIALTIRQEVKHLKAALGDTVLRNGEAMSAIRRLNELADELERDNENTLDT